MNFQESFDYIIVGAGAAGCVVAHRLSANPDIRVLLLEAGVPDDNENIHNLTGFLRLWGTEHDWLFRSEPQPGLNGRQITIFQGKVLGGGSSIHAMMYVRGNRRNFDRWSELGNEGWSYEEVLPYFIKSEDFEKGASAYHGAGGPLSVRLCPELTPSAAAFLEAGAELGYGGDDLDFNGARQENNAAVMQFNITADNHRASSASAFLTPILARPNLTVKTRAEVGRVLFEGNRAVGVEYLQDGTLHRVGATGEVILAGGAFLSPKLLLLSGIGPADHLRSLGIPVLADLPGVGQNLQDHMRLQVIYKSKRELPVPTLLCETSLFTNTGASDREAPDIQINFSAGIPGFPPPEYPFEGPFSIFVPILIQARSRGEVRLRSADFQAPPIIDPRYLSDPIDVETYIRGIEICRELAATKAFAEFNAGEVTPGAGADVEAYIRRYAETIWHPAGTCRMGRDPLAVVDPQLRVHGIEGLRIADASVMPEVTSGNTYAPCVMIGEKAADLILN